MNDTSRSEAKALMVLKKSILKPDSQIAGQDKGELLWHFRNHTRLAVLNLLNLHNMLRMRVGRKF
jgi:hypothetical protein